MATGLSLSNLKKRDGEKVLKLIKIFNIIFIPLKIIKCVGPQKHLVLIEKI